MKKTIYFDNAATTYPKPECVYREMDRAGRHLAVNAGRGSYKLAKEAAKIIEETRKEVKKIANAGEKAEVVLTHSATLACNQILGGLQWKKEDVVYVTPYEHNAVVRVLYHLQKQIGFQVEELALNAVTLSADEDKIKFQFALNPPTVVIMSHVSNVTGYILPFPEIAEMAKSYGACIIVDGSQALGLVPVSLKQKGADFYIFAGHKTLYGPLGIGGYINNSSYHLEPVLAGGTGSDSLNPEMPIDTAAGYEPGSPNVVAAAGLLTSLQELLIQAKGSYLKIEQKLRRYLMEGLKNISGVVQYPETGLEWNQSVGIVAFNIDGYKAQDIGMILDEDYGIAVRTGYHCAPLIHKYLKDEMYAGVVRVSFGRFNTEEEADLLLKAIEEITQG